MVKKVNILTVVLIVIILILGSYIVYNKIVIDKNLKNEIQELKQDINSIKENDSQNNNDESNNDVQSNNVSGETSTEQVCAKYMNAVFYGEKTGVDVAGNKYEIKETLTLKTNGTFEEVHANSEPKSGTYYIENGKLVLSFIETVMNPAVTINYSISTDCNTLIDSEEGLTLKRRDV